MVKAMELLPQDIMGDIEETTTHCYCATLSLEPDMLRCQKCHRYFHGSCLKGGNPTVLMGDVFYYLTCAACSENGKEETERMELQWLQVVMLTLYNLQQTNTGKKGYFRWKEHICAFIDRHWTTFFGHNRRKTTTWFGTVAGTLSSNRPMYFKSGAAALGENGWWCLTENKPPSLNSLTVVRARRSIEHESRDSQPTIEGLRRRRSKTTLEAAMELKAKRATTLESKEIRRGKRGRTSTVSSDKQDNLDSGTSEAKSLKTTSHLPVVQSAPPINPKEILITNELEISSTSIDPSETSCVETESSLDDSHLVSEVSGDSSIINMSKSSMLEADLIDQDSQTSVASSSSALWLTERDLVVGDQVPQCLMMEDDGEENSDLDIDICAITPPASPEPDREPAITDGLPKMEELLSTLSKSRAPQECTEEKYDVPSEDTAMETDSVHEKSGTKQLSTADEYPSKEQSLKGVESKYATLPSSEYGDGESSEDEDTKDLDEDPKGQSHKTNEEPTLQTPTIKYSSCSLYEEKQLLKKLTCWPTTEINPKANRLKRKLLVRQLKRERNIPIFNLDAKVRLSLNSSKVTDEDSRSIQNFNHALSADGKPVVGSHIGDSRVLDRYQLVRHSAAYQNQSISFTNRLVGTEDDEIQSIRSPYTARILRPFIRRDYDSRPRKLKLLEEIRAYHHRNDPTWLQPPSPPIDYCYVRPQHIPSINTTCRQFFWPGIDLSECLEYPDFSCVVLYRKFIIGFAFMVPDVKYNEAYISFIFTHPEWRGAGIASFMLYHLIQTCMGKDVTLHVSASNTAMLLYQRFGFKREEYILDFYDKYFPEDSKESRNAFFLRLRR